MTLRGSLSSDEVCKPFDDVPFAVLANATWPWLRRVLNAPDPLAMQRIVRWRRFLKSISGTQVADQTYPVSRREGIFGVSRVRWNSVKLNSESWVKDSEIRGIELCGDATQHCTITNPFGPLTLTEQLDGFTCDITDIEGICASKSEHRYFQTTDAFGRDFHHYKKADLNYSALQTMLGHNEVRIMEKPAADRFDLDMWDGRIFLVNAGGSHHFAAAAYIARALEEKVPLTASLSVQRINVKSWEWMLETFRVVHVPSSLNLCLFDIAWLVGSCYEIHMPYSVWEGTLLLLPARDARTEALINTLQSINLREVTKLLSTVPAVQADIEAQVLKRWPMLQRALD